MSIGLSITFIKYCNHFKIFNEYLICDDIDQAKEKLIDYIVKQIQYKNIDFPLDFDNFEYIWLDNNYIDGNMINYKIFIENKWIEPWDLQEIYSDVLNKIEELYTCVLTHLQNEKIEISNLFEELDEDIINDDNNDKLEHNELDTLENKECSKEYNEFENEINSILNKVNMKNKFEKKCECNKCNESTNKISTMS